MSSGPTLVMASEDGDNGPFKDEASSIVFVLIETKLGGDKVGGATTSGKALVTWR